MQVDAGHGAILNNLRQQLRDQGSWQSQVSCFEISFLKIGRRLRRQASDVYLDKLWTICFRAWMKDSPQSQSKHLK